VENLPLCFLVIEKKTVYNGMEIRFEEKKIEN